MAYSRRRRPRGASRQGDVFETEDQRNWTDASFKTYCPPLRLPFPRPFEDGEEIEPANRRPGPTQSTRLSRRLPTSGRAGLLLEDPVGNEDAARLPALGLAASSAGNAEARDDVRRALRQAGSGPCTAVVEPADPAWEARAFVGPPARRGVGGPSPVRSGES